MTNEIKGSNRQTFDLEERTAKFGEEVIILAKSVLNSPVNQPLVSQLTRSGTSIGANYFEANEANSKKDFIHKISISRKEAKETIYWLRLLTLSEPAIKLKADLISKEAKELVLIFSTIMRSSKSNLN